jgi:hypothetical protein
MVLSWALSLVVAAVRSEVCRRSAHGWHPVGGGQQTWEGGRQATWELDMGSFYCRGLRAADQMRRQGCWVAGLLGCWAAGRACPSQPSGLHAALPRPISARCRRFAREWALRSLSSFHDDATASTSPSSPVLSPTLSLHPLFHSHSLPHPLADSPPPHPAPCTLHPAPCALPTSTPCIAYAPGTTPRCMGAR